MYSESVCCNCRDEVKKSERAWKRVPNTMEWIMLCDKCMPYYLKQEKNLNEVVEGMYLDLYESFLSARSLSASELIKKSGGTNLAEGRRFK